MSTGPMTSMIKQVLKYLTASGHYTKGTNKACKQIGAQSAP